MLVSNYAHAPPLLSLCSRAQELKLLSHCDEKPAYCNYRVVPSPHSQRKIHTTETRHRQKQKSINKYNYKKKNSHLLRLANPQIVQSFLFLHVLAGFQQSKEIQSELDPWVKFSGNVDSTDTFPWVLHLPLLFLQNGLDNTCTLLHPGDRLAPASNVAFDVGKQNPTVAYASSFWVSLLP